MTERPMLLQNKDVCALLSISRSTLWRWVQNGTLPEPIRIGGCTRWEREEVEKAVRKAQGTS